MSKAKAEMEVVSKGNAPEPLQHCSLNDTSQSDDRPCSKSKWMCPDEANGSVRTDLCTLMEGDCRERSYLYHHDKGEGYIEVETLSSSRPCIEQSSNDCTEEEMPFDHDRNYVELLHKQSNGGNDDYNADQDQSKHLVCSEEHTYQRKGEGIPHSESNDEMKYDYLATGVTLNHTVALNHADESSTQQNESDVSILNSYNGSRDLIEMTNLPVEVQESCDQRNYEYLKQSTNNANHRSAMYPDKREICIVREYIYPRSDYVIQEEGNLNNSGDSCNNKYHNYYELKNEEIDQDEITASTEQQHSEEQSYIYQPDNDRFCNREEPPVISHANYQIRSYNYQQDNSEKSNYIINEEPCQERTYEDKDGFLRKCNSLAEEENKYTCEDNDQLQRDETSAVDLRILRPLRYSTSSGDIQSSYNKIHEQMVVSQASDDLCVKEHLREEASSSETCSNQDTNLSNSSYIIPDQMSYEEAHSHPTHQPRKDESFDHNVCESTDMENNNLWDAATNTDHTLVEDKESQTGSLTDARDVAVQTDIEKTALPFAYFKNMQEEITKHACPICQRVYISKSSFDRHLRTHDQEKNNVIFTTEAKLQICKRASKNKHLKTHKPIIIQVPRSIFQCNMCEKMFPNQRAKDNHDCTLKPFPLTKCPECHIKFYTTGALNEHIGIVHKKVTQVHKNEESAYYCIFCNKSFSAGYNFHLHLDEHLSSQ